MTKWTECNLTGNQKGDVGEAIVKSYPRHVSPIMNFLEEHAKQNYSSEFDEQHSEVIINFRWKKSYHIDTENSVGERGSRYIWEADYVYSVKFRHRDPESGEALWDAESEPIEYPAEIKTGEYAELSDRQKPAIEAVSRHERLHPLLVQISLEGLPEKYSVRVREVKER